MKGDINNVFRIFQEPKTIKWIANQKSTIDFDPPYQRLGRLWNKEQKQLLIDSIINGFDIPKIYFHLMPQPVEDEFYSYAIIDGKQRIEAILEFISGEFPLSDEFTFFDDELQKSVGNISGKNFDDIDLYAPSIIARFWQYELNIVFMDTTCIEIINKMFIRLNSGVAVNTAEKRNATGGELSLNIQRLCNDATFFKQKIKISNRRLVHNDLALKLLMIELGFWDLTKVSVNKFVIENKEYSKKCADAEKRLRQKLSILGSDFKDKDKLLSKKNIVITLYSIFDKIPVGCARDFVKYFEECRSLARNAEGSQGDNLELAEFNRLLQQGADKKSSIQRRSSIMLKYLENYLQDK